MTESEGPSHEIVDRISRLCKISLFKGIAEDTEALSALADLFVIRTLPRGKAVISEGDFGEELYVVNSGTVEIVKRTRSGDPYTVAEISAEMNAFFGELALLDPDKRSATVICKTDCEFSILNRNQFTEHGNRYPGAGLLVTREISKILCQRLRKANTDMITLFDALVNEVRESGGIEGD